MMFLFDWRMGLITLTGLLLFFAVNAAMQRAEQTLSRRKFNADEQLVAKVLEYVQGIAEVKNFDLTHDSCKGIRLQRDARIRCAVFFSGSIRFQISTSMTTVSSTSHGSPHRTAVPRPTFIMAVMIFPPRLTGLRIFSKDDISHLRFLHTRYTLLYS